MSANNEKSSDCFFLSVTYLSEIVGFSMMLIILEASVEGLKTDLDLKYQ
jgi:hypothetical protein